MSTSKEGRIFEYVVVGIVTFAVAMVASISVMNYATEREKTEAYYECLRIQERAIEASIASGTSSPTFVCWR